MFVSSLLLFCCSASQAQYTQDPYRVIGEDDAKLLHVQKYCLFIEGKSDYPAHDATAKQERPCGPLAVSYDRGHKGKKVPCRYDFVYATPDISVKKVSYLYEESQKAGSDHGMVLTVLDISERR